MQIAGQRGLEIEDVRCDLCGADDFTVVWRAVLPDTVHPEMFSYAGGKRFHGRVVRCRRCGLRYVSPRPQLTGDLYSKVEDPHYEATRAARLRAFSHLLPVVGELASPGTSLLDLGCATGPWLEVARSAGYRVRGVEPSRWAAAMATRAGLDVDNCTIEDLSTDERFDIVTCLDVLEHVDSPIRIARKALALLKPGGHLLISVPDFSLWHTRLLGRFHWLVVLMHYYYFEPATIRRLLTTAGFVDVRTSPAPRVSMALGDAAVWFARWGMAGRAAAGVFASTPLGRVDVSVTASVLAIGKRPEC